MSGITKRQALPAALLVECMRYTDSARDAIPATCKELLEPELDTEMVSILARELIDVYESSYCRPQAERAAYVAAQLATWDPAVEDLLIASGERYVRWLRLEDAFPYHPNAFDALAMITHPSQKALAYLRQSV